MASALPGPSPIGRWQLPNGWTWRRAKEFAKIVGGGTPRNASDPHNYSEDGTPWLTPADLSGYSCSTISRGRRSLSPRGLAASSARMLPKGAVLISSRAPIGYCAVAGTDVTTNQGFRSLVCDGTVNPFFIRYYTLFSRAYLEASASGTTFKELSGTALGELLFPVPPLATQHRIVARIDELFSELDDGDEDLRRARTELEIYRKSLLKGAVTGELTANWRAANPPTQTACQLLQDILSIRRECREADTKNAGRRYREPASPRTGIATTLPSGWTWASLDQLCERITDGTHQPPKFVKSGVPFLVIRNVVDGKVNWDSVNRWVSSDTYLNETARLRPSVGDILYTAVGSYGVAVTVTDDREFMFQRHIAHFRPTAAIRPEFLAAVLNSPLGRKQADLTARGVAQKTVTLGDLARFGISVPPIREQDAICSKLSELSREAELATLFTTVQGASRGLRQSIFATAFRGALVQ